MRPAVVVEGIDLNPRGFQVFRIGLTFGAPRIDLGGNHRCRRQAFEVVATNHVYAGIVGLFGIFKSVLEEPFHVGLAQRLGFGIF